MMKKETIKGLVVLLIIVATIVGFNVHRRFSDRHGFARRIAELSPGGAPPRTIEDLRKAIGLYEAKIEQHVRDASQTAVYWKILGTRLQDRGLHSEALDAFARAIEYTPEQAVLHHLRGVSARILGMSSYDDGFGSSRNEPTKQEYYFSLAEKSFLRAIQLEDRYARPRYMLGLLYVFELNRPEEAIPHLERFLEISRSHVDAMFVLARAYFVTGQFQRALALYDQIASTTRDPQRQAEAENNRRIVLGLYDG